MHGGVAGQLRVKRGHQHFALAHQHRVAGIAGQHFDPGTDGLDDRRANEDHFQRLGLELRRHGAHAAGNLAAVGVARDDQIGEAQRGLRGRAHFAGQENGARAGAEERAAARGQRAERRFEAFVLAETSAWWCFRRRAESWRRPARPPAACARKGSRRPGGRACARGLRSLLARREFRCASSSGLPELRPVNVAALLPAAR